METFEGKAHIPGESKEWIFVIDLDWNNKEVTVDVEGTSSHITSWQGLAVQTFGDNEICFRTKGIPPLMTHWWHFVRPDENNLWGIIVGLPDEKGLWTTCPIQLTKAK